ncbi:hypothetical protein ES703_09973 [subsurface metagenome]
MHKYERRCWSCESEDIENKGSYVQCRQCGATWNEVAQVHFPIVAVVDEATGGSPMLYHDTAFWPSGYVQGQAARARSAKRKPQTPE